MRVGLPPAVLFQIEQRSGQGVADLGDPAPGAGVGGQAVEVGFEAQAGGEDQVRPGDRPQVAGRGLEGVGIDARPHQGLHRHFRAADLPGDLGEHGCQADHLEGRGGAEGAGERREDRERPAERGGAIRNGGGHAAPEWSPSGAAAS